MKQALKQSLILGLLVVLSACDKSGGGGGGTQQTAQVPSIPGPQGVVAVPNSPALNCNFTGGTVICYGTNFSNTSCNSTTLNYTSIPTLCTQLMQLQTLSFSQQCNYSMAVTQVYNQWCLNQPAVNNTTTATTNLNPTNDPYMKTVQCDFEAYRVSQGGWLRREARTPKLTATMTFDGRMAQSFDLRSQFLGFDIGNFGRTMMTYKPAGIKGTADTLTISNDGLDKTLNLSQSGFAGQSVKLEVMNEDATMKLSVSCVGKSQFKKNAPARNFTQFVCRGTSSLYGSDSEQIDVSFPYNASLLNTQLALGENLTAIVTGDEGGKDNAIITFTADGVGLSTSLQSSAYLKTISVLHATDGAARLDLTCGPQ